MEVLCPRHAGDGDVPASTGRTLTPGIKKALNIDAIVGLDRVAADTITVEPDDPKDKAKSWNPPIVASIAAALVALIYCLIEWADELTMTGTVIGVALIVVTAGVVLLMTRAVQRDGFVVLAASVLGGLLALLLSAGDAINPGCRVGRSPRRPSGPQRQLRGCRHRPNTAARTPRKIRLTALVRAATSVPSRRYGMRRRWGAAASPVLRRSELLGDVAVSIDLWEPGPLDLRTIIAVVLD